jgi:predicted GNAT superfamily acetyltransferase
MRPIDWTPGKYQELQLGHTKLVYLRMEPPYEHLVELVSVRTPVAKRRQGSAREALSFFLNAAAREGLSVTLCASPLDKRTKISKLVSFYQSLGFVLTGRSCNMAGDPEMEYRADDRV